MNTKMLFRRVISLLLTVIIVVSSFSVVSAVLDFDDEYEEFLYELGYYESRNRYNIQNSYGYMGRWQLGYLGLIDIGFMDNNYNYTSLAAQFGVYSDEDFLNTPDAQDYAVQKFHQKAWDYILWYGDEEYIGKEFNGITITVSGLIGACHLVGVGGVHEMLKTGEIASDANGSPSTFYLEVLAGYDISRSIGADIYDAPSTKPDEPVEPDEPEVPVRTESTVHFFENYSGTNYLLGTDFSSSLNSSCIKSRNTSVYQMSIDKTNKYEGENTLKIVGKSAGGSGKDMFFATDLNGNAANDGYLGDSKTLTLSFYAKSSVSGVNLKWRWGYESDVFLTSSLTTSWKKYSVTFTKNTNCGSALHPYFDKAATVNIANIMLVDGTTAATITSPESKTSAYKSTKGTIGNSLGTLPVPTRKGYTFDGWYTKKVGGEQVTASTVFPQGDIRYYARWSKINTYQPIKSTVFNGHYYTVFEDELSWSQAKNICAKMGGHLVTIESKAENDAVKSLISSNNKGLYWIGCSDTSGSWSWVTGESFSYANWASGQPSGGSEHYGQMYAKTYGSSAAGTWNDVSGTSPDVSYWSVKNTGYICEFEPENYYSSKSYYKDGTLYEVVNIQTSWENAKYYAELTGGHLVTISDAEENRYVNSMVSAGTCDAYWIGASDVNSLGNFKWVTGESFSYSNWDSGNPSSSNNIEHYVEIYKSALKWNDVKNTGRENCKTGFIIEHENYIPALLSVSVITKPTKTTYVQGEELDLTGLTVKASYELGIKEFVDDYTVSGYNKNDTGVQTITVNYNGKTASFSIYVKKKVVNVTGVTLDKTNVTLREGESIVLNATVSPSDADTKTVTWSVSDSTVATVSSTGKVYALKEGTATVTVKTKDGSYTAKCVVNVEKSKVLPKALLLGSKPSKVSYELNEEFDPTGMIIKVKYEDGTTKDVTDKVVVSGFDSSKSSQHKVTVSYTESGKTVSIPFTVFIDRQVKNLYVTSKPTKTTYILGEQFERAGMTVVATFTDGITRDVTNSIRTSGFTTATVGVNKMTVSYTYRDKTVSTTFSFIMKAKLEGLTIVSKPTKIVYIMDEAFNKTGLSVMAKFNDGTTKDVSSNVKLSGYNLSEEGIQTVTATYSYGTQTRSRTFSIVVTPKMSDITIARLPTKLEYKVGDGFNKTGLKVYANLVDGSQKDVSSRCAVSGFDSSVPGEKTITVKCTYGTVTDSKTFKVTVK